MQTKSTMDPIGLDHYLHLTDEIINVIQHFYYFQKYIPLYCRFN